MTIMRPYNVLLQLPYCTEIFARGHGKGQYLMGALTVTVDVEGLIM